MTNWIPLSDALEHVLLHERDAWVSKRRLHLALADGRVRSRGYDVSTDRVEEQLARSLFTIYDDDRSSVTFNFEANSLQYADYDADFVIRRVELAWEDIVKIWPEPEQEQTGLRRGRKRQFDREQIAREAEADVAENGRPRSRKEWADRVTKRLEAAGEPVPGYTLMMDVLKPKYQSFR